MKSLDYKVINCTVTEHDYAKLIGQVVQAVFYKDDWVVVEHRNVLYVVNEADLELE